MSILGDYARLRGALSGPLIVVDWVRSRRHKPDTLLPVLCSLHENGH